MGYPQQQQNPYAPPIVQSSFTTSGGHKEWKWGYSRFYGIHYGPIPVGVIVVVVILIIVNLQ